MKIAKATKEEIKLTREFLQAAENVLSREKFGFQSPEDQWESWNDEDEDKILILKIQKRLSEELYCDLNDVDNRILMYEYLQEKYYYRYAVVIWAADILIDNVCDPTDDCLAFSPEFVTTHVAPEQ